METIVAVVEADQTACNAMQSLIESMSFSSRRYSRLEDCLRSFDPTQTACMVVGAQNDGATEVKQLLPLLEQQPAARVILLTDGSPTALVVKAMRAGVSCVLEHPFSFDDLIDAVKAAIEENTAMLQAERKRLPEEISELLTRQEEDIAMLLVEGAATKEIAARLDLSVRTIHYRKNTIFKKIGAENRNQAIKMLTR
jgi:FixJ family two-component response regulator